MAEWPGLGVIFLPIRYNLVLTPGLFLHTVFDDAGKCSSLIEWKELSMSIELTPATPAEIAEFKLAVAQRFKERGMDPKQASAAFDAYMGKLAAQFGIRPEPSAKVVKLANAFMDKLKARNAESTTAVKSVGKAVVEDVKGTKTYKAISEATKKKPTSKTAMLLAEQLKEAVCKSKGKKKPMAVSAAPKKK